MATGLDNLPCHHPPHNDCRGGAQNGLADLVSSVGTVLATLGIDYALRSFECRNANGPVTTIGSASVENKF